ncbi:MULTISPECIES: DRTGG domain-containing protein [Thermotoga]|uniref:DRTGG domain protein n=1 Tax=Thermotoga neapolitana (strain ATCC 49049 / DSM 4359 / NBRC 107923 / NS-E) TaxID=309803 RepID=B9K8X9_THENN|nr:MULTISPECIES: DRTGG domain-containing protein [Thermotoga]MDK2785869.1 hypothetical protein [Thermotoga sp.]HBF11265.1 hypothetical protein [Thermotoga neapolitana]ACM23412.1 DRTGG domain protein [Thermotoga neapolitana DSM 4359]AJG41322.1 hypothetical protein TRQ7_07685 [Thermotoga sp. RQ7]KFZ21543.1 DRTGG domain protein [Thermotoga neapolitana LA10]
MTLEEIASTIEGVVLTGDGKLEIEKAVATDLMSDVLAFAEPGVLLITGLHSPQAVRTAMVVGIPAVLFVRKKDIPENIVKLAEECNIAVLATNLSMFETCGRLFLKGLKPIRRG